MGNYIENCCAESRKQGQETLHSHISQVQKNKMMKDRSEKLIGEKSASDFLFEDPKTEIVITPKNK